MLKPLKLHSFTNVVVLPKESDQPLKIKFGCDPTGFELHLGHLLVIKQLQQWQQQGHKIQLVIGDFTARIGDPTGKNKTRPPLTEQEIIHNYKTYVAQINPYLDMKKVEVYYNSEWFGNLNLTQFLPILSLCSLNNIIRREDFNKRLKDNTSIGMHEILYPILQGYDSVIMESNLEVGGTDQTFNMLMGREIQQKLKHEPQGVATVSLIVGLDGVNKMSKSLNNHIALDDDANTIFAKVMSISDDTMNIWAKYFAIDLKGGVGIAAMQDKMYLASFITDFIREGTSKLAQENFINTHSDSNAQNIVYQRVDINALNSNSLSLIALLKQCNTGYSVQTLRKMVIAGGVDVNNNTITNFNQTIDLGLSTKLRIGKKLFLEIFKLK